MHRLPLQRGAGPSRALTAACLLILCVPAAARGQADGVLEGGVTAAASGAPIAGATITVVGTGRGAVSGADGAFRIGALVPGAYRIRVDALGWEPAVQDSLYGNYAMGGVIRLTTEPITPTTLRAGLTAGSRDLLDGRVQASDLFGRLAVSAAAGISRGGGHIMVPESSRGAIDIANESERRNASACVAYTFRADRTVEGRLTLLDEQRGGGTPLQGNDRRIGGLALSTSLGGIGADRLSATLFGTIQEQKSSASRTAPDRSSETHAVQQTIPAHDVGGSVE